MRPWVIPVLLCTLVAANPVRGAGDVPILIGLDADMSSGAAQGGEAIRRGVVLAIDEINAGGGVLGRPLELLVRDHRGNPARGIDNIEELGALEDLVAVVGGVHTPVAMGELDAIHRHRLIYLDPWAAGTAIIDNGRDPNFVFRISVRDEFAGDFLVQQAVTHGFRRPGLLLERTSWGRSNEAALRAALAARNLAPAAVQWFNWGVREADTAVALGALARSGVDVIILVSNPREGAVVIRAVAALPEGARPPMISHWGITGGDFPALVGEALDAVDLTFLQTFSFLDPPFPDRAQAVIEAYCKTFGGCDGGRDIPSPVGTAHAYDLVHLLARAIATAGTTDRAAVRDAMERLGPYRGLVRDYDPPFSPGRHDALTTDDYRLARFAKDGAILPLVAQ